VDGKSQYFRKEWKNKLTTVAVKMQFQAALTTFFSVFLTSLLIFLLHLALDDKPTYTILFSIFRLDIDFICTSYQVFPRLVVPRFYLAHTFSSYITREF
jgi:hypothetical protein